MTEEVAFHVPTEEEVLKFSNQDHDMAKVVLAVINEYIPKILSKKTLFTDDIIGEVKRCCWNLKNRYRNLSEAYPMHLNQWKNTTAKGEIIYMIHQVTRIGSATTTSPKYLIYYIGEGIKEGFYIENERLSDFINKISSVSSELKALSFNKRKKMLVLSIDSDIAEKLSTIEYNEEAAKNLYILVSNAIKDNKKIVHISNKETSTTTEIKEEEEEQQDDVKIPQTVSKFPGESLYIYLKRLSNSLLRKGCSKEKVLSQIETVLKTINNKPLTIVEKDYYGNTTSKDRNEELRWISEYLASIRDRLTQTSLAMHKSFIQVCKDELLWKGYEEGVIGEILEAILNNGMYADSLIKHQVNG